MGASTSSFRLRARRASARIRSSCSRPVGRPVSKARSGLAARKRKITPPADLAVDAEVDLHLADGEYFLSARLNVSLPGVDRETAKTLVQEAHEICPYSKATRGNIEVGINLV